MAVRAMLSAQPPVLRKSDFFPYMVEVLESRAKKSDFLKSDFFPYMVDLKAASDAGMQLLHFCILHPHMCDAGPRQLHPCIPASPCSHKSMSVNIAEVENESRGASIFVVERWTRALAADI